MMVGCAGQLALGVNVEATVPIDPAATGLPLRSMTWLARIEIVYVPLAAGAGMLYCAVKLGPSVRPVVRRVANGYTHWAR